MFDPRQATSPCYRFLYPEDPGNSETCGESGIIAPLTGILGSMQALESIKLLSGAGETLCGFLLLYDALRAQWRRLRLPRDPRCPVCAAQQAASNS